MEEMEATLGQMFVAGGTHNCREAESEMLVDVYWYKKGEVKDPLLLPLRSQSRMVKKEEVKLELGNPIDEFSWPRTMIGEEDWEQFKISEQLKVKDFTTSATFQSGAHIKEEAMHMVTEGHEVERIMNIEKSQAKEMSKIEEKRGNLVRNLLLRWKMDEALRSAYALHVREASDRSDDSRCFKNDWQEFEYLRNSSGLRVNVTGEPSRPIQENRDPQGREAEWEEREDFESTLIHSKTDIDPLALPLRQSSTSHRVSGRYQFKEELKGRKQELTGGSENEPHDSDSNTDETRNKGELGTAVEETNSACNDSGSLSTRQSKTPTSSEEKPAKPKRNVWMSTEKSFQRIPCEYCDEIFISWHSFNAHVRAHRNDFKCSICAQGFSRQRHLNHHMKSHTGNQRRYSCPHCDKTYVTRSGRSTHVATHSRLTLPCGICEKTFPSEQSLRSHQQRHQRGSGIRCETCGKTLKSRKTLAVHRLAHTEERRFTCAVCLNSYLVKWQLSRHIKSNPPQHFSCGLCKKVFVLRETLDQHAACHSIDGSSVCNICGKKFPTSSSLKRHVTIHFKKNTDLECPVCHEIFRFKKYFNTHLKNHSKKGELSSEDRLQSKSVYT